VTDGVNFALLCRHGTRVVLVLSPVDSNTPFAEIELHPRRNRTGSMCLVPVTQDGVTELAKRSRGTPRVAYSRFRWVCNYATSEHGGTITLEIVRAALEMAEVDDNGLDKRDRRYLETLMSVGQTGLRSLAATMNLPPQERAAGTGTRASC
jgi:Holliday junction resolvasome RuvABC ATP-dependent DNA helicase subunit